MRAIRTTTHANYQPKHPKSSGTSGEVALARLLQDNHIRYETQVPVKTPFSIYTFLVDFVLLDKPICIEVDGGLHRKNWGGSPALRRMAKDEVKTHCLEAYGFKVLRFPDSQVKKDPATVLAEIRDALR